VETLLTLTIEDVIQFAVAAAALVLGLVAVVVAWVRQPMWSLRGLDREVAEYLNAATRNPQILSPLEGAIDKTGIFDRGLIEFAQAIHQISQSIPGQSAEAVAKLGVELVDGVPVAQKIAELERRLAILQNGEYSEAGKPPDVPTAQG
jgi:hypothetical protein